MQLIEVTDMAEEKNPLKEYVDSHFPELESMMRYYNSGRKYDENGLPIITSKDRIFAYADVLHKCGDY